MAIIVVAHARTSAEKAASVIYRTDLVPSFVRHPPDEQPFSLLFGVSVCEPDHLSMKKINWI
jgi:hypothetical protein